MSAILGWRLFRLLNYQQSSVSPTLKITTANLFLLFCDFDALQVKTRELALKMGCNFYSPMKMHQEISGSNFLKEIGKRKHGVEKKWNEEGVKERVMGVIKREAKWMKSGGED
jgi:hypothetical protein